MIKKNILRNTTLIAFIILFYLPIAIILYLTLTRYNPIAEIIQRQKLIDAIWVSFITSIISTIISVALATFASVGIGYYSKKTRVVTQKAINLPLTLPDIIIGIGLLSIFLKVFRKGNFGWTTLILAHVSFSVAYAFVIIYPKAKKLSKTYYEASEDLGATPWKTFWYVILPNLRESIVAGAAVAFAMSFDDYIISKLSGGLLENISSYLISSKRVASRLPGIYSLTTIIVLTFGTIVIVTKMYKYKKKRKF